MGTKSYVKPICDPRVRVNTNEIQSPCAIKNIRECVRQESDKIYETLNEKDKKTFDKILENCDDSHDDH